MIYEPLGKFVRLSQGLAVNKGTSYLFSNYKTDEFIYPLLRIVDLESGNHSTFSKYVSKDVSKSVVISEDTIVFSRVTCQCFRGFSGVVHNNLFVVEPINDFVSKDYLFTILQSSFVRNQALNLAKSSVVPDLTHDMFKSIRIPIPEKSEQNKIVAVYQSISSKISNNNAICADLEGMAKDLYDYWFVQFDFPDENGKPYKSSGGKMVWNDELKREIPEGWEVKALKGLYQIDRGLSYTSKDIEAGVGVPMLNLACVDTSRNYRDGELKYHAGKIPDSAFVNAGDLMIACTDLTRERAIIGCPILVPDDGLRYTYSMDLAKISFSSSLLDEMYMYMTLRTEFYHNYIKEWASGTTVLHLNLKGIDWYNISIPPVSLQEKYATIMRDVHSKKSQILSENRDLVSLRDFLLPMLMNGQVKVKGA